MSTVEQQRKHFESISDKYVIARQHPNHLLYKTLMWRTFFERNPQVVKNGMKVIEPMCGYSEGKSILQEHCGETFEYTGFDFSRPLVERARQTFPKADIYVQDVTRFEGEGNFDLMILIGGLHHVYAHVSSVMEKLSAALKPGGFFINLEPTQNNRLYRWVRSKIYHENELFDEETEQAFDLNELNGLYRRAGLEIRDQMYPGLLAYIMYYNPDAFPGLNVGSLRAVRGIHALERPFYHTRLARYFSFATLTLLQAPPSCHDHEATSSGITSSSH